MTEMYSIHHGGGVMCVLIFVPFQLSRSINDLASYHPVL